MSSITFFESNDKSKPFEVSIEEIVADYYKSSYCTLPMRYDRSLLAFINDDYKKEGSTFDSLDDSDWYHIHTELEKQRK